MTPCPIEQHKLLRRGQGNDQTECLTKRVCTDRPRETCNNSVQSIRALADTVRGRSNIFLQR
ncbi:hypothetical protein M404DRAFT_996433 [Pisolithus tinctorius Marx 270]|uniref:Uncharacterized protein n=1 Tax=Pisolithus tinctorius Marx 270 TaxID=870435 RepID=A0A0C3PLI9_PISTI|nr:hypothetical protein M404DRAFT_996433 [Pisolithus tinctorius Marx 270]